MVVQSRMNFAQPLLILALPRSYSSLACAMLGQHPQLFGLLETELFEVGTMSEWWQEFRGTHDTDGLTRAVAEVLFGAQTFADVSQARRWLRERRRWGTADIARLLAEKLYPLAFVEKTPVEHASKQTIRERLRRRLETFPVARFLHLVRNPRAYGLSHLEHLTKMARSGAPWRLMERYRMMMDRSTSPPTVDPQVLWLRVNTEISDFMAKLPKKQGMTLRGEDLVSNPTVHCTAIAQWLGLRADPPAIDEMLHPENSPFASIGPPNAMFGGDPKFFRDPVLRCQRETLELFGDPLPWRDDGCGFSPEVLQLAEQLGYKICRTRPMVQFKRTRVRSANGRTSRGPGAVFPAATA